MAIAARLAYDVWVQLISDEELYRAVIDGTHHQLAASRGLDADKLAVLDVFHAEPGTRWNVENLRFRSAMDAVGAITRYLPRTARLLTRGDPDWLQELAFEYLSHHRWVQYGHYTLTECERFGAYVRDRVMKRRITPPHLAAALDFELGVIRLLKRTAEIPPDGWPPAPPVLGDDELAARRIRRAPAVELIDLPVDIRDWVESADPWRGTVRPSPVTFLVHVPSLDHVHRIKILGEGPRLVLERFTGAAPAGTIAAELDDEYGIERAELFALVRGWLEERILMFEQDR